MKIKHIPFIFLATLFTLGSVSIASAAQGTTKEGNKPATDTQRKVYVELRSSKLRSSPTMWSAAVADLKYGDALSVLAPPTEGWLKAKTAGGKAGFVSISAVTDKKVVLSSVGANANVFADPSEVVLAGKGFSKEIEEDYAKSQGVNYAGVNAMEKQRVSYEEIRQFARAGKLNDSK